MALKDWKRDMFDNDRWENISSPYNKTIYFLYDNKTNTFIVYIDGIYDWGNKIKKLKSFSTKIEALKYIEHYMEKF